ncbi:peptidase S8/S53 domain-containing protein [Macrophomina phaseolina]|uniref:Peptidase S8/S53 domain-containing protein n=1 Tax=Macrophomina phaseolina TaxID=35725 RepID=A0ABQ8GCB1_9PEZI|nr:peptidase S8/S53 domain-containing protein [Macrophomina phaseolina]
MRFVPILSLISFVVAAPLPTQENELIPGKYIVVLKPEASSSAFTQVVDLLGDGLDHKYEIGSFKAAAGSLTETLLTSIRNLGSVAYVEQDAIVRTAALTTQPNAPWGLGRISHRAKDSPDYVYDTSGGEGTCAYIIDTGIYTAHPDFGGRATFLENFSGDGQDTDGNGHGTHVAGTVGSATYGVAKKTSLLAVKVLDASGSGSNTGVLAGIAFAARDAKEREARGECVKGSVGNLSLGGIISTAQMQAVRAAVDAGLFLAVAAGNSGLPTILFSPANEQSACTVGATDKDDKLASFSNFGLLVDVLAPGVDIKSTWNDGKTNIISGTSMATPHVAGLGAYLLGLEQRRSPRDLCARIQSLSTKDKVTGTAGLPPPLTKNYLAFNGASA